MPQMPMVMEGPVSDDELERMSRETEAKIAAWAPSVEAWAVLNTIEGLIGRRVEIQAWDPMMIWLEDEGPFPFQGRLVRVERPADALGRPVPTLLVDDLLLLKTEMGYDGTTRYERRPEQPGVVHVPVADLFSIRTLREKRKRR